MDARADEKVTPEQVERAVRWKYYGGTVRYDRGYPGPAYVVSLGTDYELRVACKTDRGHERAEVTVERLVREAKLKLMTEFETDTARAQLAGRLTNGV